MCGMGLALLLVLVTLAAAELSMRLLLMSAQLTGKRSYDELARYAYGRIGAQPVRCVAGWLMDGAAYHDVAAVAFTCLTSWTLHHPAFRSPPLPFDLQATWRCTPASWP